MLNDSSVQHSCWDISPTAYLPQVIETLEDDAFPLGETVSNVGKIVTRVTVVHINGSHRLFHVFLAGRLLVITCDILVRWSCESVPKDVQWHQNLDISPARYALMP